LEINSHVVIIHFCFNIEPSRSLHFTEATHHFPSACPYLISSEMFFALDLSTFSESLHTNFCMWSI